MKRRWFVGLAAAVLAGWCLEASPARADGTSLLDMNTSEKEQAETREWLAASRSKVDPARLPVAVARAALAAVPSLKTDEAAVMRHRPMTSFRSTTEYVIKGHDEKGQAVWVRTTADGGAPAVTRVVPVANLPEAEIAEARRFAAKHGYTLTTALVVTREERSLLRATPHTEYYLRGTSAGRPGVEQFVWLSAKGKFRLRDLDDLVIKQMALEVK